MISEIDRQRKSDAARARPARSNCGVKGVTWAKDREQYKAYIQLPHGVVKSLGYHDRLEDAKAVREAAEKRYWPKEKPVKKLEVTLGNCWNPVVRNQI